MLIAFEEYVPLMPDDVTIGFFGAEIIAELLFIQSDGSYSTA